MFNIEQVLVSILACLGAIHYNTPRGVPSVFKYLSHLSPDSSMACKPGPDIKLRACRRKIRLIESNAKCRHLQKLTCRGTLRQLLICLRPLCLGWSSNFVGSGQIQSIKLLYSIWSPTQLNNRGNSSQSWVENTNMTDCISSL